MCPHGVPHPEPNSNRSRCQRNYILGQPRACTPALVDRPDRVSTRRGPHDKAKGTRTGRERPPRGQPRPVAPGSRPRPAEGPRRSPHPVAATGPQGAAGTTRASRGHHAAPTRHPRGTHAGITRRAPIPVFSAGCARGRTWEGPRPPRPRPHKGAPIVVFVRRVSRATGEGHPVGSGLSSRARRRARRAPAAARPRPRPQAREGRYSGVTAHAKR